MSWPALLSPLRNAVLHCFQEEAAVIRSSLQAQRRLGKYCRLRSRAHICCRLCVLSGCHRTVTDVQISMLGLAIAVVAVLSSALQQIMCGAMQRRHLVSSHQLLSNTAHVQARVQLLKKLEEDLLTRHHCLCAGCSS